MRINKYIKVSILSTICLSSFDSKLLALGQKELGLKKLELNELISSKLLPTKSESAESDPSISEESKDEPFVAKFICEDLTEEDIKEINLDGENENNEYVRPSDLKKLSVS